MKRFNLTGMGKGIVVVLAAIFASFGVVNAGTFSPNDIDGIRMWLDASQITGLNAGDRVHQWADSSGNNVAAGTFHARYNNAPDRSPTYEPNALSGRPVVRFDPLRGDSDNRETMLTGNIWTSGTTSDLGLSQPATLITVYAPRSAASDNANWAFSSDQVMYQSNRVASQSPFQVWIASVTESLNTFNVDTLTMQGTDNTSQYYRNGDLFRTGTIGTTASGVPGNLGNLVLGAKANGSANKSIDYAEVIAVNRAINAAERNALDFYLEMKYDLASSAGGVMLTGTAPGSTIITSGTVDTLEEGVSIVGAHRGSLEVDLDAIGMGRLTFLLDFEDVGGTLDTDGLLAWLDGLSNGGQFYSVSLAPLDYPGYDLAVRYTGLPGTQAYFNWDTGDPNIQLVGFMAIPEPTTAVLLLGGLATALLKRRR